MEQACVSTCDPLSLHPFVVSSITGAKTVAVALQLYTNKHINPFSA